MTRKSIIDLVNECDNFQYASRKSNPAAAYFTFHLIGVETPLGYVLPDIATKFAHGRSIWQLDTTAKSITFNPTNNDTADSRTQTLAEHMQQLREAKIFKVLDGWRDELYPVYGPGGKLLFSMERSGSALLGIVTYGVHMTVYTHTGSGMKVWTPKRSPTKQTYPGMMDNTVAGGLSTGERPFECMVRESSEEASLPEDVASKAKSCGTMTYFHVRDERAGGEVGLCQPECQYVYDLEVSADVVPKPGDNEAVDFQLLSIDEVREALATGKFKPNCALLLVEFFVRHGILTPENEPNYLEVVSRLHRRLEFPMGQVM